MPDHFWHFKKPGTIVNFIKDNNFIILDYNNIELVIQKSYKESELKKGIIDGVKIDFTKSKINKTRKLVNLLSALKDDETIVYCSSKYLAEDYALKCSKNNIYPKVIDEWFDEFKQHIVNRFTHLEDRWCLGHTLEKRIGIHHGTIPKYIQKEIIKQFNRGLIKCIFSTTTITEGVNTSAKNMIIIHHKKGEKQLKKFDVLNIMGRAGRFNKYFSGRVIILDDEVNKIYDSTNDELNHKNYSQETEKSDENILVTKDEYLSEKQKMTKEEIEQLFDSNQIPVIVRKSFLTFPPRKKNRDV